MTSVVVIVGQGVPTGHPGSDSGCAIQFSVDWTFVRGGRETEKRRNGGRRAGGYGWRDSPAPFPRLPVSPHSDLLVAGGELAVEILDLGNALDGAVQRLILLLEERDTLFEDIQLAPG